MQQPLFLCFFIQPHLDIHLHDLAHGRQVIPIGIYQIGNAQFRMVVDIGHELIHPGPQGRLLGSFCLFLLLLDFLRLPEIAIEPVPIDSIGCRVGIFIDILVQGADIFQGCFDGILGIPPRIRVRSRYHTS